MVMDATQPQQPSPQSVGREFVRQYYTLLNKAPGHLHRFYNNNSSFIHGESTLVVGQRDIHNRIQQLNFNDCHAKISQVDAQATLGNGVVVQVTGELSNDGQPMRRFTQTFVLAAQSPKKYYVHNDIFRYQDHLYTDDEGDGETRSENGDEHELPTATAATNDQQSQTVGAIAGGVVDQQQLPSQVVATAAGANVLSQQPQQIQQQVAQPTAAAGAPQQIFYSLATTGASGRPVTVLPAGPQAGAVPLPAQFAAATASQQVQTTQLNGVVAHDELLAAAAQQQTATVVAPITSPLVQPTGTVPVAQAGTPILQPSVGIVPAPAATVIPGFQQSPLVAPQGLQQPQQQQQLGNTPMHLVIQPTANVPKSVEIEDNAPVNNSISTNSVNENSTRSQTNVPVPKPPTPVAVDDFKTINEQQQQEKYEAAKQQQNEPKTYANLFKSTSSSPSGFVNAALQQQQQLQQQQNLNNVYHSTTSSATSYTTTTSTSATTFTNSSRLDNNLNSNGSLPQRNNSIRNNKDYEQRRSSNAQFGDNQQLFLGNIPHHASEDDLKGLFSRFGTVLELRILSKPANKLPPGVRNPLNYGFITFDDAESVQKCLSNCPLYFPENSPDAQKLNVEEKKPRPRNDLPPRQQIGGNNMNNNIGRNIGGGGNGPQSRSITNSNSNVMRNNGTNGGLSRSSGGGGGGPRVGGGNGGFQRNDRSGGASNGPLRGGGNNSQSGNTYGRR